MPTVHTGSHFISSTTTVSISTSTIFTGWIRNVQSTATGTAWTCWTNELSTTTSTIYYASDYEQPQLTEQELAEQERRMAIRREQARIEQLARRRAQRRAMLTMLRFIQPHQREEFKRHGHFHVRGGATEQAYRINKGRVANIDVLDPAGKIVRRLCAHPAMDVPDCDTMLAQALYLQSAANEEQFVRTANIHPAPRAQ